MSETPLTRRKAVKTVEEIKASPSFASLPSANQKDFVLLLAGGASPMAAIGSVYNFHAKETARQFMYHLFRKPRMQAVLHELYGETERDDFLRDVTRAAQNPKTTPQQVQALMLYAVSKGFVPPESIKTRGKKLVLVNDSENANA